MTKTIQRAALAAVVVFGLGAFANEGAKEKLGFELPSEPKAFMERLHHSNQQEIELGKLAQQKAENPQVKQFGQMLVQQHQQLDQQLTRVAQQQNLKLAEKPSNLKRAEKTLMEASKATKQKLQTLEGKAFDQAFLATMVSNHDLGIAKAEAGLKKYSNNSQLASLLRESTPKLMQHRDQAYQLLGQVKSQPSGVGGAGMEGSGEQPSEPQPLPGSEDTGGMDDVPTDPGDVGGGGLGDDTGLDPREPSGSEQESGQQP